MLVYQRVISSFRWGNMGQSLILREFSLLGGAITILKNMESSSMGLG
jgi:hypothetical protein